MPRSTEYGGTLLADLRKALRHGTAPDEELVVRLINFLDTRLTDAAKAGCHHCDEGEKGTPCWWCGLKNR